MQKVIRKKLSSELWSVMESNPIKVINPTQSWGGKKLDPRLDPLNVKSLR